VLEYLERIARAVWRNHYRIPESAYWVVLVVFSVLTPLIASRTQEYLVGVVLQLLVIVGIARWHFDRRRCRGALVVARFREGGGTEGHADEAQRIVVDSLWNRLSADESRMVQAINATVSGDQKAFAASLARRLRAPWLLHGRLAASPEGGGWSVLPRLLEPSSARVFHMDPHTRDITTLKGSFEPLVSSLKPERGVNDDEFPFEFCLDLEALIRGLAGIVAHAVGDDRRAVSLLQDALRASPQSTSHALDGLRMVLADSLWDLRRKDEALAIFRRRLKQPDPAPRLLRHFAFMLWEARRSGRQDDRALRKLHGEMLNALRRAVEDRADPEWDISAYNLMSALRGDPCPQAQQEADELLDRLLGSETGYGHAWYVLRERGVRDWHRVEDAHRADDLDTVIAAGAEAARWYRKALKARPKVRFFHPGPNEVGYRLWVRFPPSPIIFANLVDAHSAAQHRWRMRWYEWRFRRTRSKLLRRGRNQLLRGAFERAYANSDWAQVGRHDFFEIKAHVLAAIALHLAGRTDEAEAAWGKALDLDPFALVVRVGFAQNLAERGIDATLPGTEPVNLDAAVAAAEQRYGHPIPRTGSKGGVQGYWYGAGKGVHGLLSVLGPPLYWLSRYPGWRLRVATLLLTPLLRMHHRRHPGDLRLRYMLGRNALLRGDFKEAVAKFTEALDAAAGDYPALVGRAVANALAGKLDAAEADLRRWKAFSLEPGVADSEESRVLACAEYGFLEPRLLAGPHSEDLADVLRKVFPVGWASLQQHAEDAMKDAL
jgi:tetratricopeptide (TPR) repeat protein